MTGRTRHSRINGRFITAAGARVQQVQRLGDLPDSEWDLDEQALQVLEAGMARAREEGWRPPAPGQTGEVG